MPDGWEQATLGDIATTVQPSGVAEPGLRYVGLEHLDPGSPSVTRWGSTENVLSASTAFEPGSVLFSKLRPYLNKVAVPDFSGRCTNEALVYQVANGRVRQDYLALILGDRRAVEYAVSGSAGSRMPRTSSKYMSAFAVMLPPLPEQRRIVDLIGSIDDAITAAESAVESLLAAATATINRALGDETPQVPLGSVFSHVIGGAWGSPPGQEDVDVLALGPRSYAGRTEVAPETASPRSLSSRRAADRTLKVGDIVLERSGGTPTQPVGRVIRMTSRTPDVVPSDFQRLLRPDPAKADPGFVFWHMWANYEAGRTVPFQRATTNIRNLNIPSYLAQTLILLPDLAAQQQHGAMADSFAAVASDHRAAAGQLRALRSNLLTALLSGEHRFPGSYDDLIGA